MASMCRLVCGNGWTIIPIRWLVEAAHLPKLFSPKTFFDFRLGWLWVCSTMWFSCLSHVLLTLFLGGGCMWRYRGVANAQVAAGKFTCDPIEVWVPIEFDDQSTRFPSQDSLINIGV